jgi:hypothetical protein
MKRMLVFAAVCLVLAITPWAADPYKLVLKDGTVLTLDKKPLIGGNTATITRGGLDYTVPVEQVDLPACEKANPPVPEAGQPGAPGASGPKRYTDEDLGRLRETSPLASEGGTGAGGVPRKPPAPTERKPTNDARLLSLYDKEEQLQKDRADWINRLDEFQEQYDALVKEQEEQDYKYSRSDTTTTRGADQARWQKQQEARKSRVEKDLAIAREKVKDVDDKLEDVRREIYREYDKTP